MDSKINFKVKYFNTTLFKTASHVCYLTLIFVRHDLNTKVKMQQKLYISLLCMNIYLYIYTYVKIYITSKLQLHFSNLIKYIS